MPEAVWFPEAGRVEIREEPPPALGPADVRIRAVASGVSAGSELLVYLGDAPAELEPDLPTIAGDFGFPVKFGYASVGRIVEAGQQVTAAAVNDLVFVHHPHQTEYVVPSDVVISLPPELPPEVGVFTANLETAVTVALDAHPRLSEAVLVTGQGVMGLLMTMLLRMLGAHPIITVDRYPLRRKASVRAGAHSALAVEDAGTSHILELTAGRGVDLAVEASGSPAALQSCIDSVAFGGTVVVASWYGTRQVALALGTAFHRRRIRILSSQVSTLDPAVRGRWDRSRRMSLVTRLLSELSLSQLVTHRLPFQRAASAYELINHHPEECLQVVLDYV